MDPLLYRTLITSRGFLYHYYFSLPNTSAENLETLPTLLFLHGFPSTSRLWRHQVTYFASRGYPLLVPDLLGFGGSALPVDPESYRPSDICRDILDILDAENVQQVVVIGHDLGSKIGSRLANLYPTRFLGFGFLAVSYIAPRPLSDIAHTLMSTKKMCGYELCGHTLLLGEEGAEQLIENHLESFYSAMFPDRPTISATYVAPVGALKKWLQTDKRTPIPTWITEEDTQTWFDAFKGSLSAPLCWYKANVQGIHANDDKPIPLERYKIDQPVFFAAAHHDFLSRSVHGIAATKYDCNNATIREFQAGHWLMLSAPTPVNSALNSWIMDII